ncbi:MAG: NADPH:quinone reductase-like Zn-dependent oxidoreductase [Sediminicola sp.]|jgi:NADPH:quinone reductase-like Zn-dependent oxidoreductase
MNRKAEVLWHNKETSWIEPQLLPELKKGQILVRAIYSMISQGTERTVITQPLSEDAAQKMSVPYLQGSLVDSFTYGYSIVGEVISGSKTLIGKYVHLMHPHQDFLIAAEEDIFIIPDHITLKEATLASNIETAINAVWDAEISIGDRVLIYGYGTIGALIANIVRNIPGVKCEVNEIDVVRRQLHLQHGISMKSNTDYDVAFNTTANNKALQEAITITRQEGKIIELSWYGNKDTILNLGADFHYGRKQIISSQVSQIPHRKKSNWDYRSRKELCFRLLAELDLNHLITKEVPFKDTPSFYHSLRQGEKNHLGIVIKY